MNHTLSNIDESNWLAYCAVCGPNTNINMTHAKGTKSSVKAYYGCRNRLNEIKRKSDKKRYNPAFAKNKNLRAHRITLEQYEEILDSQGGACAICRTTTMTTSKSWHIDHDHACCPGPHSCGNCVRGLLCNQCNLSLGGFKDSPVLLQAAIEYLKPHTPI